MNVTIHRRCSGAAQVAQRIREISGPAGQLVASRIGGRIPQLEIVLTDRRGVVSLVHEADLALAGAPKRHRNLLDRAVTHWRYNPLAGTTLTPSGALVAIDTTRHRDLRELDRTLVHEFAHCVQLTMPGARQQHIDYLRQQTGITKHSKADQRAYDRLMDKREREAERLESLARQLPKGR